MAAEQLVALGVSHRVGLVFSGRVDGVADEHGARPAGRRQLPEEAPALVPVTADAEVAAHQQDGAPLAIGRGVPGVAQASVAHAPLPAHVDRARRHVDRGHLGSPVLQVEGVAAGAAPEVEYGTLDRFQALAFPREPCLRWGEELRRRHRGIT